MNRLHDGLRHCREIRPDGWSRGERGEVGGVGLGEARTVDNGAPVF
jgi:hypothetical protein